MASMAKAAYGSEMPWASIRRKINTASPAKKILFAIMLNSLMPEL